MVDVLTQTEFWKWYKQISARIDLLTDRVNCLEFVVATLNKELEEWDKNPTSLLPNIKSIEPIDVIGNNKNTQKVQNGKRD